MLQVARNTMYLCTCVRPSIRPIVGECFDLSANLRVWPQLIFFFGATLDMKHMIVAATYVIEHLSEIAHERCRDISDQILTSSF